jgi:hypothetical protein
MAITPRPTPTDKYALGRNSFIELYFHGTASAANTYDIGFAICISEGSLSLDTDTIEINSNCQNGWKVKLPGLKSGTLSFTGYIASSINQTPGPGMTLDPTVARNKYDIMQYLGEPCVAFVYSLQNPDENNFAGATVLDPETPFALVPDIQNSKEVANGFFKTGSVTISPDDAVKVSMSVELSGKQTVQGYVAVGGFSPNPTA